MANAETIARDNQKLVNAFMAKMEPIMDKMFEDFKEEMRHHIHKKSIKKSNKSSTRTDGDKDRTDRDRERIGRNRDDRIPVKENSVQNRKVGDQRSKQQDDDDLKKSLQKVFEAIEAVQKERRALHQSVGSGENKEGLKGLENQKPELEQPLPVLNEPTVPEENVETNTKGDEEASGSVAEKEPIHNELVVYSENVEASLEQVEPPTRTDVSKHVSNRELINTSETEQAEAKEGGGNVEKHSATPHSFICPMSFQKQTGAEGVLFDIRIKEKPPDRQRLPYIHLFFLIQEKPPDRQRLPYIHVLFLIKDEPPDAATQPKTRLHILEGDLDLRSNPLQVGEDDVRLSSPFWAQQHSKPIGINTYQVQPFWSISKTQQGPNRRRNLSAQKEGRNSSKAFGKTLLDNKF